MFIVIPLKILENLTCTECYFYLSTQVKVYKYGKIICERCSRDNDGGTISKLYETVLHKTRFPCINHYNGCRELLFEHEVLLHEIVCRYKQSTYNCLLCNTFEPSYAYSLQHHLEHIHEEYALAKPEFFVNLNHLNQNLTYYYKTDSLICFIFCKYEVESYKFTFNIYCAIQEQLRKVKYRMLVLNMDNKRLCRTKIRFCHTNSEDVELYIARVMPLIRDRIVFVRLHISEDSVLMTPENITYLNPTLNVAKFRCKFNEISLFQTTTRCYSKMYTVGDVPWRVNIWKNSTSEEDFLAIYLTTQREIFDTCNVNASFTLVSTKSRNTRTKYFGKDFQNIDGGGFDDVVSWRYLIDNNFGYLENNAITIDVFLEVGAQILQECIRSSESNLGKGKKQVRFYE